MNRRICLEPEALQVAIDSSKCPLIFQLPPKEGRKVFNDAQKSYISTYPVRTNRMKFDTGTWGSISLYFVAPCNHHSMHHVIYYIHGGGWVFGNFNTHYKLIAELAARTNSIVVFPEYSLSPEAKYPTALEQCYAALICLPRLFKQMKYNVTLDDIIVAGDSVGGNMATVLTMLSKFRNGPYIHGQVLYYPVTNACFTTPSYREFACNYYLYRAGMIWFWNQYTMCIQDRDEITASPLRATLEQLEGLPAAIILNGEADVLRDEGEAYARRLRCAGVEVTAIRYQAIIHDFVMLNALDQTYACRAAMDSSTEWIRRRHCTLL